MRDWAGWAWPGGAGIEFGGQVQRVLAQDSAEADPAVEPLHAARRQGAKSQDDARRLLQLTVAQVSDPDGTGVGNVMIAQYPQQLSSAGMDHERQVARRAQRRQRPAQLQLQPGLINGIHGVAARVDGFAADGDHGPAPSFPASSPDSSPATDALTRISS